jgi:hypothetical protein
LLTLFEGSTILLYPESEIRINRLQVSVFAPRANFVDIQLKRGKALFAVARPPDGRTDFTVFLPEGKAVLLEGSYALQVGDGQASVKVRDRGRALVTGGGRTVDLRDRERTDVTRTPSDPVPAGTDLIDNGSFLEGMAGWQREIDPFCAENTPSAAAIGVTTDAGQPVVRFQRSNSRGTPCEVLLRQDVNQDVSEFWTLRLNLEANVVAQSLSGGGTLGSEYPLMIRVRYRAADGQESGVVRGFYSENTARYRVDNGMPVRQNTWEQIAYEQDLMTLPVRPRQILYVEIVASGHDYESMIRRVSLVGE